MKILGISSFSHESSCSLISDEGIEGVFEEERFNRIKHTWEFPKQALQQCFSQTHTPIDAIDHFTFFWNPREEIVRNTGHFIKFFPASLNLLQSTAVPNGLPFIDRIRSKSNIAQEIRSQFQLPQLPKVHFIEHHLCHAASAFFVSEFDEAAVLTIDGRGESTTTLLARGQGNNIQKLREIRVPHSLGHLYAAITSYLGFKPFSDEWKVMGMSAYGKPTYVEEFKNLVRLKKNGQFELNLKYFQFHTHGQEKWVSPQFIHQFGLPRLPHETLEQKHYDIAYALQKLIEKTGVALANALYKMTRQPNLCLTGGVALNCLMNRAIIEQTPFKKVFIQPIANDAGTSLGSALYFYHQILNKPRKFIFDSIYLGPGYSTEEVKKYLDQQHINYYRSKDVCQEAAQLLKQGKIVGWFQGRMEAGPRALGHRSILADPRDPNIKDRLNLIVKKRESFRPFAPSVLEERVHEYFLMPKGQLSPYMILVGDVRDEKKPFLPAVTHADGTARVHTVNKRTNPKFWQLIYEFEQLTQMPILLNTSFNDNEPIVCTPADALRCFQQTEIDALVIEDFIVMKN